MRVVAPGKVVLLGEYAVVDGAPAIVAAVDRGVSCTVTSAADLEITAPDLRFVGPALARVGAPAAHYRFEEWNPTQTTSKVGLGSSAAATVAACLAGAPGLAPDDLFRVALEVHRGVQGSGSGIDVAASVYGGVLRFRAGTVAALPVVAPLVVWSGASAQTGPRVEQYLAWGPRDDFVAATTAIVDQFVADPIRALEAGRVLLEHMADEAGIAYRTPELDRIAAIARDHGGAAKPSGAGGGDCAVALVPDAAAFATSCTRAGFTVVPVAVTTGARADGAADATPD